MPHLTLEYTDNLTTLDTTRALLAMNHALAASDHFEEIDIKSRAVPLETYLIGTESEQRAFMHVKLAILSGRSAQTKSELSGALLRVLRASCKESTSSHLQLSVEIVEIERASYAKDALCTT